MISVMADRVVRAVLQELWAQEFLCYIYSRPMGGDSKMCEREDSLLATDIPACMARFGVNEIEYILVLDQFAVKQGIMAINSRTDMAFDVVFGISGKDMKTQALLSNIHTGAMDKCNLT